MDINQDLNRLMVAYLKRKGYYKTGSLARSISFDAKIASSGELDLGFKANDYILFLEDGKLVDGFFEQEDVKAIIADFIVANLFTS